MVGNRINCFDGLALEMLNKHLFHAGLALEMLNKHLFHAGLAPVNICQIKHDVFCREYYTWT